MGQFAEGQRTGNSPPQQIFGKSLTTPLQASSQETRNKQQSLSNVILQDCAFLCISRINKEHSQLLNSFTSGLFIFKVFPTEQLRSRYSVTALLLKSI